MTPDQDQPCPSRPIVVLGGSGMLGRALVDQLSQRGMPWIAPAMQQVDLLHIARVQSWLREVEPAAVVNAAAFTDVGAAELPENREVLYRLNVEAAAGVAECCHDIEAAYCYVSTDYVFDGAGSRPYVEGDTTAPVQEYGRSKLAGEQAVIAADASALIARTSTLYGPGPRLRPHYVDAILNQAQQHKRLTLVRPPVSSPTYTHDLAAALIALLEVSARGVVHVVNVGACSRVELAQAALRAAGLLDQVAIDERPEPSGGLARPAYSVLDTAHYSQLTGKRMRPWADAVAEYVQSFRGTS